MDLSSIQTSSAQAGTNPLQQTADPFDREKLREASQQFEAIFIRQFIEKSLTPLLADPVSTPDGSADIHRHMIADTLSDSLSKQSVFGLSDILELQLRPPMNADSNAAMNLPRP